MNRSEKAALIAQIKAKADAASFVVVTDFKGMTVEELTRLRAKLYECGGEYLVVKNTLARIALTDGMHDSVKDMFKEKLLMPERNRRKARVRFCRRHA